MIFYAFISSSRVSRGGRFDESRPLKLLQRAAGLTFAVAMLCARAPAWTQEVVVEDPIDAMLRELSMTRRGAGPGISAPYRWRSGMQNPPLTMRMLTRPLEAPYVAGLLTSQHRNWSHSMVMTVLQAAGRTPAQVRRGYQGNPLASWDARLTSAEDPFVAGLEAVWEAAGRELPAQAERRAWEESSASLPDPWKLELGRLLMASASAAHWQTLAFERLAFQGKIDILKRPPDEIFRAAMLIFKGGLEPFDLRPAVRYLDFDYLLAGGLDLAVAAEDFEDFVQSGPPPLGESMELKTPLGWIVLRAGDHDDVHGDEPRGHHLLIVDIAGDDLYTAGVTEGGIKWPVQMIFDLEGDDDYLAGESLSPAWGGAVAGYSLLLDLSGDDDYIAMLGTQGSGVFGVGMLFDRAGNDRYQSVGFAQGSAYAGLGILFDNAGNDQYDSYTRSQGCGQNLGSGTLIDMAGDDRYTLKDDQVNYPSAQSPGHNNSMGQGMGSGQRFDLIDGKSIPGGIGLLYDAEGDDTYSAGVFAQGCAYLGGTGILVDDSGADTYRAVYYAQGAAAHWGAGILIDRGGDDVYVALEQSAQGLGHDMGLGWLLDLSGNDRYSSKRLSMGAANENGWGIFVDMSGNDSYEITASPRRADSLGAGKESGWGTMREDMPALGLFLDAGGTDSYQGVPGAADNAHWRFKGDYFEDALRSERGIGWDGEYPSVELYSGPRTPFAQRELDRYAREQSLRREYRRRDSAP